MNSVIPLHLPRWWSVAALIACASHLLAWGPDPGDQAGPNAGMPFASVGLQSLERVFMADIFFRGRDSGGASQSADRQAAIVGEGFFQILLPEGMPAYTRNGSFKVTSEGLVATRDGLQFVGGMPAIPPETTAIIVTGPGGIFLATSSGSFAAGRVTLVRFSNPAALKSVGPDLFIETAASGPPETGNPGENGFGEIGPGFLRLPGSFGFTMQLGAGRNTVDVEVSADTKAWTVLAAGLRSDGEKLFIRDILAANFEHKLYRVRSKPRPNPAGNGQ